MFRRGHIRIYARLTPSLVPINQMNACAGDNSRKNLIPMLMKTFHIGTIEATGLLKCVVCDTAIDINADKLNCAEDHRIRWTTYQNLALWFGSWEAFLINYGFATIIQTGELIIEETMKKESSIWMRHAYLLTGAMAIEVDVRL